MGMSTTPPLFLNPAPIASPEHTPPSPPRLTKYYTGQHPNDWDKGSVSPNSIATLILEALSLPDNPVTIRFAENLEERIVTFRLQGNDDRPYNYHFLIPRDTFPDLILPRLEDTLEEVRVDKQNDAVSFTPKFVCTRPPPAFAPL